jgi:murein DD-endopeptidase MepM/ murein hydrolase activator NlpD
LLYTKSTSSLKFKKTFTNWLTTPYKLVIRNEEDLAEKSTLRFTYAKLITLVTFTFIGLFALSLFLVNTILAKWFNPVYIEQENTNKLLRLSTAVESLEEQATQQNKFIKLMQSIVQGKEEPSYPLEDTQAINSKMDTIHIQEEIVRDITQPEGLEEIDTDLRNEFEEKESNLSAASYNTTAKDLKDLFFFTPIEGVITTAFNVKMEHYGVDIVAKENEPIKCIVDGMVIFDTWTVETGWVIAIQHSRNLVSIYKHNATLFKKAGDFVTAGEVVAIMGNSGELSTGPHLHFELWYEGSAVNPENFINF